jgi:DNA-binding NtrC family response regulator
MSSYTVLLVDDEPNLLQGLRRALRREPYEILVAEGAAAALRLLEARPVDVVVSDETMPGMSGTEFLGRVRSQYPDTIRIILTGHGTLKIAIRAINDGEVYRFLTKPCDPVDLALTIRQALQRRALLLETRQLLRTVRRQSVVIDELGRGANGLTEVARDQAGAILLDEVPTDLDALLNEVQAEIEAAESRLRGPGPDG